ncbi:MAG: hypothetical protein IPM54_03265 [Polyangiaceae bacterium]|nr:hypothetical protein [Polyangiaceae bacterium]
MRYLAVSILFFILGCGGSKPAAETQDKAAAEGSSEAASADKPAEDKPKDEATADDGKTIPEACANGTSGDGCVMPKAFVKRLCSGVYPELALMFFQKGTPWKRAYVAVKEINPFNGFSGPSSEEKLFFEEELLVLLSHKADTGGMQVSGAGSSYDVLRWDGSCATLSGEEVRLAAPPKPKHATIPWRILEDATQEALKKDEALAKVASERRKECKGATMGAVSAKCEKADRMLNDLVVEAVRNGTSVPKPAKVPQ